MKFIDNLSKEEYIKFWESIENNHFMQSYEWGQAQKINRKLIPYYVGLKDDNDQIVAAALLLKKKYPFKQNYFYCPRGYTIDFKNKKILKEFTKELKIFLRKENSIYLKMDPPIKYQTIDMNADKTEGENNYELYDELLQLGYKHKGFNKLYEGNQPRYTFRTYFNKYDNEESIKNSISKGYMRHIKKSFHYNVEVEESSDIKTFYKLIKITSAKSKFETYTFDYYKNIYNEFEKQNHVKLININVNPSEIIERFQTELKNEKNEERINKLKKDIVFFNELDNNQKQTVASYFCVYSKTGAWSLYLGSNKIAEKIGCVHRLYYEIILDAQKNNYEFIDVFGTIGDPKTKYKNLAGIYEHKRQLGGEYIEFIGEFDLTNKIIWYKIIKILLKITKILKK